MARSLLLAFALFTLPAAAQAPAVTAISPSGGVLTVPTSAEVVIDFDRALDPASVLPSTVRVFGRWSGPAEGTLALENGGLSIRFTPDGEYFFGEAVSVQLSKGIRSASGIAMDTPFASMFWTGSSQHEVSGPLLETATLDMREPGEGPIISYGAYAGDLDGDGSSDLAVPNEAPSDVRVLLNDGHGNYGPMTVHQLVDPNSLPSTSEGADLNADGNIDVLVGHGGNNKLSVMLGDGAGGFSQIDAYTLPGNGIRGLAVFDADGDGDDDVVAAARFTSNLVYLPGNGDGTLGTATPFDAQCEGETALAAADANQDGILDLFVGCHFSNEVVTLLGDGDGGFSFAARIAMSGSPWMLGAGDLDGDGHVDVASASSSSSAMDIAFGDGSGGFVGNAVDYDSGQFTIAIDLGDIDNDGDLDAVTSNFSSNDFIVYLNDGTGTFSFEQRLLADGAGSCAVIHDRDGDGAAVEITAIDEIADRLFFYEWSSVILTEDVEPNSPDLPVALEVLGNPASGSISLRIRLDAPQDVRLSVVDLLGREVAVLVEGARPSGVETLTWNPGETAAGTYIVRLDTKDHRLTQTLTYRR